MFLSSRRSGVAVLGIIITVASASACRSNGDDTSSSSTSKPRAESKSYPIVTLPFEEANGDPDFAMTESESADPKFATDGRFPARIVTITDEKVVVDFVGWYTGKPADDIAARMGQTGGSPGGFHLENDDGETRELNMGETVEVTSVMLGYRVLSAKHQGARVALDLRTFIGYFDNPRDIATAVISNPFWITVKDGKVARLDELYVA